MTRRNLNREDGWVLVSAIVLMAIMLDRTPTAASERSEVILKMPMSPVRLTWQPPQNSRE